MISYKDKTFCASKSCQGLCGRKLTEEDRKNAKKLGLPICMSYFCNVEQELLEAAIH